MDRNDGGNLAFGGTLDQISRLGIEVAILFEVFPQFLGIEGVSPFVDVHERDVSSRLGDGFGCGDERVRNRNYDIAVLDATGHEGEAQCVRPAIYADAKLCIAELRKLALELLHHASTDETRVAKGLLHYRQQLILQFLVRCHQIEKRNFRWISHSLTFSPL